MQNCRAHASAPITLSSLPANGLEKVQAAVVALKNLVYFLVSVAYFTLVF